MYKHSTLQKRPLYRNEIKGIKYIIAPKSQDVFEIYFYNSEFFYHMQILRTKRKLNSALRGHSYVFLISKADLVKTTLPLFINVNKDKNALSYADQGKGFH